MRKKKILLGIRSFIILLMLLSIITIITKLVRGDFDENYITEYVYCDTYYTLEKEKLVDNKVSAVFANLFYYQSGYNYSLGLKNYKEEYSNTKMYLYIDDNTTPYKTIEIPVEEFISTHNIGYRVSKGCSCFNNYKIMCDNKYEFDLTGVTIKESFRIEFYWYNENSLLTFENQYGYKKMGKSHIYVKKFDAYSQNDEVIVKKVYSIEKKV